MVIRSETRGRLLTVTLDRPDKANALTAPMLEALTGALDAAAGGDIGAVVLTGAGTVFSAGADLDAARAGLAVSPLWERLSARVASMPCLTIAALNGTAAGGALGMVLACDIRLAVPGTRFFYPALRLGFRPQPSDPARLAALAGPGRAAMMLMGGAKVDAAEALAWGLVDRIVAAEALPAEAEALCEAAVAADPALLLDIKRMLRRGA